MTTFQLKMLALVFMTIDHIGFYFEGAPVLLRLIGRLAFPLFLFCMTQGWRHTRSRGKFLLRLYGMSLLMSGIMYFCGSSYGNHNIFITLFWTGVFICLAELFQRDIRVGCAACGGIAASQVLFHFLQQQIPWLHWLNGDILCGILPNPLHCEYGILYILLGTAMYFLWDNRAGFCAAYLLFSLVEFCNFDPQFLIVLALPLMLRWNGTRGPRLKWFFYFYYPIHTLALFWLSQQLSGTVPQ